MTDGDGNNAHDNDIDCEDDGDDIFSKGGCDDCNNDGVTVVNVMMIIVLMMIVVLMNNDDGYTSQVVYPLSSCLKA